MLESEIVALNATLELAGNSPGERFSMSANQFILFANMHTLATERCRAQADPTTTLERNRIMPVAEQGQGSNESIIVPKSQLSRMQAEINRFNGVQEPDYSSFGEIIMGGYRRE